MLFFVYCKLKDGFLIFGYFGLFYMSNISLILNLNLFFWREIFDLSFECLGVVLGGSSGSLVDIVGDGGYIGKGRVKEDGCFFLEGCGIF